MPRVLETTKGFEGPSDCSMGNIVGDGTEDEEIPLSR